MPFGLGDIFGGGGDQKTKIKLPKYLEEYMKGLADFKGQGLRDARGIYDMMREYTPYTNPRIAGFSDDTTDAFGEIRDASEAWGPEMSRAEELAKNTPKMWRGTYDAAADFASADPTVAGALKSGGLADVMNPYTDEVINRAVGDIEHSGARQELADQAKASRMGAHGGGGEAVLKSLTRKNTGEQVADTTAGLRKAGFDSATDIMEGDAGRRLHAGQTLAGIAGGRAGAESTGLRDLAGIAGQRAEMERAQNRDLMGIGSLQQGQDQRSMDLAYNDFLEQRNWPFQAYNFLNAVGNDQQFNPAQFGTQQTSGGGGNGLGQIAGLGLAALGTWGAWQ